MSRPLNVEQAQGVLKYRTDIVVDWNTYINTRNKVAVTCKGCGHKWGAWFSNLRAGRKCIKCGTEIMRHSLEKSVEQVKRDIAHRTDITIDWDNYINTKRNLSVSCKKCGYQWSTSLANLERQIQETLELEFGIKSDNNHRVSVTKRKTIEFDIYYPDYNLAIEVNGIYWHSSEFVKANYHQRKNNIAEQNHINLIHIFEDDWYQHPEIYISMIGNYLKSNLISLNARDCEVREISSKDARDFYNQNHLQGSTISKVHIGLFHKDNLVSAMSLATSRFNKSYQWELTRFANHIHTNIRGSASKLLSHFIRNHNPKSIVSYANRLWSQGNLYRKLGFVETHRSQPSYFYIDRKTGVRLSRYQCQRKYLPALLGTGFDESKSESENMKDNGYLKIYNSGTITFELLI